MSVEKAREEFEALCAAARKASDDAYRVQYAIEDSGMPLTEWRRADIDALAASCGYTPPSGKKADAARAFLKWLEDREERTEVESERAASRLEVAELYAQYGGDLVDIITRPSADTNVGTPAGMRLVQHAMKAVGLEIIRIQELCSQVARLQKAFEVYKDIVHAHVDGRVSGEHLLRITSDLHMGVRLMRPQAACGFLHPYNLAEVDTLETAASEARAIWDERYNTQDST